MRALVVAAALAAGPLAAGGEEPRLVYRWAEPLRYRHEIALVREEAGRTDSARLAVDATWRRTERTTKEGHAVLVAEIASVIWNAEAPPWRPARPWRLEVPCGEHG